eukprot:jgi/Ulvmu1/2299/UM013_0146.1
MTTRLGFRPRPVDVNKELAIVRDEAELDHDDSLRDSSHAGHDSKEHVANEIKKKSTIIPIPPVTLVPTYGADYLPVHSITLTYIKGPMEKRDIFEHQYYEYDLDSEDCAFLQDVNQGTQDRLQPRQLERMLWQLEVLNDGATQQYLQAAGASAADRSSASATASTDHMRKPDAVAALARCSACQPHIRDRVYEFWREKRKNHGKPCLRRLQAPTPDSDNNPHHVFRQRTKPNKPLTRRRRETQEESLEKLRAVRHNVVSALRLAEAVRDREAKKTRVNNLNVDIGQFQLLRALRDSSMPPEELERRLAAAHKTGSKAPRAFDPVTLPKQGDRLRSRGIKHTAMGPPIEALTERARAALQRQKRQKITNLAKPEALAAVPIPPKPPPPPMPCLESKILDHAKQLIVRQHRSAINAAKGAANAAASLPRITRLLEAGAASLRIGRGGRMLVDTRREPVAADGVAPDLGVPAEASEKDPEAARLQDALTRLMDKI